MSLQAFSPVEIPTQLVEAIRHFPTSRDVEHCGRKWSVSPFDFYATCPECSRQIKLRSFSANREIEDVFDAMLEWIAQPGVEEHVRRRQAMLAAERDDES